MTTNVDIDSVIAEALSDRTKQEDAARAVALTYSEYLKTVEAADAAATKHKEALNLATKLGLPEAGFRRAGIKKIDGPAAPRKGKPSSAKKTTPAATGVATSPAPERAPAAGAQAADGGPEQAAVA